MSNVDPAKHTDPDEGDPEVDPQATEPVVGAVYPVIDDDGGTKYVINPGTDKEQEATYEDWVRAQGRTPEAEAEQQQPASGEDEDDPD